MITAVDPRTQVRFVPESEKKKKAKTAFLYLPMTELEKVNMATVIGPGEGQGQMPETFLARLVIEHLCGWENFKDSAGTELEFSGENVQRIPWIVILDIGADILKTSGFGEVERKN